MLCCRCLFGLGTYHILGKIVEITEAIGEKLNDILGGVQADINKKWDEGDIDIIGGQVYIDIPTGVDNLEDKNYDIIN